MKEAPLKLINPYTLAKQSAELKGSVALSQMSALAPLLNNLEGSADYHLEFSQRADRKVCIDGQVRVSVSLTCQRCDQAFQEHLVTETHLQAVLNDTQAGQVVAPYEPLLVNEDHTVPLADLVQEEIILALPMFAKHPEGMCKELH